LQLVRQLKNSQFESTTIVSRSEGKIEELSNITKDMQRAFHDLAGRIVERERQNRREDDQYIHRIEAKLQQLFADHISGVAISEDLRPACTHNAVGQIRHLRKQQSELDQRLTDLLEPSHASVLQESDAQDWPEMEKTSKYKTWLGEIYMNTVARTYFSADEIAISEFQSLIGSILEAPRFPITITKTDILLLPRTWGPKRAATIRCHQLTGPSANLSNIWFEIRNFCAAGRPNDQSQFESIRDGGMSTPDNNSHAIISKLAKPSQSLLYTAFKTAFVVTQVWDYTQEKSKQLMVRTPIPRNSFDDEINDIIELVHLWINSGLDADFYKNAFPGEMTRTKEQSESVFQAGNNRLSPIQRLRHEYAFQLVLEMMSKRNSKDWLEGKYLDEIHHGHWERCQTIALSSNIETADRLSSIYQASCESAVFLAPREGDTRELRHLFDARLASPFAQTSVGTSFLESALLSAKRILTEWLWFNSIPVLAIRYNLPRCTRVPTWILVWIYPSRVVSNIGCLPEHFALGYRVRSYMSRGYLWCVFYVPRSLIGRAFPKI
jgi:hypothetical protein